MADLTVGRRQIDPYPGVTLKSRRIELSIAALKLDIYRAEIEILEHQELIVTKEGSIKALEDKISELEAALKDTMLANLTTKVEV